MSVAGSIFALPHFFVKVEGDSVAKGLYQGHGTTHHDITGHGITHGKSHTHVNGGETDCLLHGKPRRDARIGCDRFIVANDYQ